MERSTPLEVTTAVCRREELLKATHWRRYQEILPVILKGKSDSSSMDMAVELLLATGRSLPEVMMMMVPEAWKHKSMDPAKGILSIQRLYHGAGMALLLFLLPTGNIWEPSRRNGLRPSRYTVQRRLCGYVVRGRGMI